jgi:hypothetical protein
MQMCKARPIRGARGASLPLLLQLLVRQAMLLLLLLLLLLVVKRWRHVACNIGSSSSSS